MPSALHYSSPPLSQKRSASSPFNPSTKKQKMSLTQTYYLAHTARSKLSKEASRGDHNLRRLVGHANLLDGLMLDLVEAERSQEALFNTNTKSSHIKWAPEPSRPTIVEDYQEDDDNESDSDDYEEVDDMPILTPVSRSVSVTTSEIEEDDQATDDEEDDYEHLALVRTSSRSSPPELFHDSDEDSDEEVTPPSPPTPELPMSFPPLSSEKKQESIQHAFEEEGFYLPTRSAAVAVY